MPTKRARLAIAVIRAMRVKKQAADVDVLYRAISADHRRAPAQPPRAMWRKYSVRMESVGGHRVFRIRPRGRGPLRQVIYLHGGGWVFEMQRVHWKFAGALVRRLNCEVVVPLFPLAPEYRGRDMHAMLLEVYRQSVQRAGAEPVTLMGDSSGGNLALSLAMQIRDQALPQPAETVLIYPGLDVSFTNPRIPGLEVDDVVLGQAGVQETGRLLCGDMDIRDPYISPLFGTLDGLAPIALFTGTHDLTYPDSQLLRESAVAQGFPLAWYEYPGMIHGWILLPGVPEAARAMENLVEYVQRP